MLKMLRTWLYGWKSVLVKWHVRVQMMYLLYNILNKGLSISHKKKKKKKTSLKLKREDLHPDQNKKEHETKKENCKVQGNNFILFLLFKRVKN